MKHRVRILVTVAFSVIAVGVAVQKSVRAEPPTPAVQVPAEGARVDWEFTRMTEMVQAARDYVQRRKDLLGSLPSDVQTLVAEGQQRIQELKQAVQQRDLKRSRRLFRVVVSLFEEVRLRLNEAMDAQSGATTTPEQVAASLQVVATRMRAKCAELRQANIERPDAAVDDELSRIENAIDSLEASPSTTTSNALRDQIRAIRRDLQAVETAIVDRSEDSL